MQDSQYSPEDPENAEWDVIVIGTGMGGSTLGYSLSGLGRKVLFIEKGKFLHGSPHNLKELRQRVANHSQARLITGHWPERLQGRTSFGNVEFYAPLGCGTGGTTGLYGAQLERFWEQDFYPKANFPDAENADLPEKWPISYEELLPYYRQAESLFRVCGTTDPLNPDPTASFREPPPLSDRDQALHDGLIELGLNPYRAHVGYEYVKDCYECTDICPLNCKNEAGRMCLIPALSRQGANILTDCEVLSLRANHSTVHEVRARWNGRTINIPAKIVVLAAGAYMTPVILMNSRSDNWPEGLANRSGLVGRNLMLHTSDFLAVDPPEWHSPVGPRKTLSLNDFYLNGGRKLGALQTVGIPFDEGFVLAYLNYAAERDPRWWRKFVSPFLPLAARQAPRIFRRATMLATIVEDLPYHENRVLPDSNSINGMRFQYRYTRELRERNYEFRRRIAKALAPRYRVRVLTGSNNINYGHVCGTCRFGDSPETSVLDRDNRAHDLDNLYIVDASFFPTSGGTNPSLTIAANALRVGQIIHGRLN